MTASNRIALLDVARSLALLAMVVFHFTYDLALFRLIDPATPFTPFWALFARLTAGSFLFLAGISLWLAHGEGVRVRPFLRRLAVLVLAAAAVSLGTRLAMGESWVRFGILHSIATCSVLGLLFLRLPTPLVALTAVAVFLAPVWLDGGALAHPGWTWLIRVEGRALAVDYVPVLPWLAPFLAGMALGKAGSQWGLWDRLRGTGWLGWPGRHSLVIYLLHQPVLIALVAGWAALMPTP